MPKGMKAFVDRLEKENVNLRAESERRRELVEWERKERKGAQEAVAGLVKERDALRAEVDLCRADLHARLSATVHALGGIVEGNPTGQHNFFQRIRELRGIEFQVSEYRKALEWIAENHASAAGLMAKAVLEKPSCVCPMASDRVWDVECPAHPKTAEKPKSEVGGRGNCSECGALVEHLYSLRCPACYEKLVAGMEKRAGSRLT